MTDDRPDIDAIVAMVPKGYPSSLEPRVESLTGERVVLTGTVDGRHHAGNGFLHAGALVTLADTACGYGCMAGLPDGASGFTTVELKSNHVGTIATGTIAATATRVHAGRTTQVWDATVTARDGDRPLALFRCTQMILYPRT